MDHSRWLQRPLGKSALQYAAADIHKICLLYETFVASGYISSDSLVRQSASYIALHAKGRPYGNDEYNRHGLLPLALLTEPQAVPMVQCRGCSRHLPASAFSQSGSTVGRNVTCFVCKAVDARRTSGGNARFSKPHTYEDLDYDEDFAYEDLDYDEGFDDTWDEGFYDADY